eukprot:TRINITY_DN10818_c0_g1_i1.p1 TRINITY_DN10818_c0_g1~~TRINITY_DN10818_c0_g1_i1.p1  ORF type:complete len:610 (-),score=130.38 TRINITY_DN10818_c0_g1_i1:142-1971(-)
MSTMLGKIRQLSEREGGSLRWSDIRIGSSESTASINSTMHHTSPNAPQKGTNNVRNPSPEQNQNASTTTTTSTANNSQTQNSNPPSTSRRETMKKMFQPFTKRPSFSLGDGPRFSKADFSFSLGSNSSNQGSNSTSLASRNSVDLSHDLHPVHTSPPSASAPHAIHGSLPVHSQSPIIGASHNLGLINRHQTLSGEEEFPNTISFIADGRHDGQSHGRPHDFDFLMNGDASDGEDVDWTAEVNVVRARRLSQVVKEKEQQKIHVDEEMQSSIGDGVREQNITSPQAPQIPTNVEPTPKQITSEIVANLKRYASQGATMSSDDSSDDDDYQVGSRAKGTKKQSRIASLRKIYDRMQWKQRIGAGFSGTRTHLSYESEEEGLIPSHEFLQKHGNRSEKRSSHASTSRSDRENSWDHRRTGVNDYSDDSNEEEDDEDDDEDDDPVTSFKSTVRRFHSYISEKASPYQQMFKENPPNEQAGSFRDHQRLADRKEMELDEYPAGTFDQMRQTRLSSTPRVGQSRFTSSNKDEDAPFEDILSYRPPGMRFEDDENDFLFHAKPKLGPILDRDLDAGVTQNIASPRFSGLSPSEKPRNRSRRTRFSVFTFCCCIPR